ncbi:TraB/GumN family protein [Qipengyuania sp. MTN3-11]|uniref:TraB/GumN family protein n=1 Tax=Qipengyuania sp. MTN3-11 TaxID=3056557 RepID=UPI0036F35E08
MIARFLLIFAALIGLAACQDEPDSRAAAGPGPAIWEVRGADGAVEGWLFGTIHALPDGVAWRTATLAALLDRADTLVVEVAGLEDGDALTRTFSELAFDTPGPALARRIEPGLQPRYEELLTSARVSRNQLDRMESWAAALSLAQVAQAGRTENGVDKALLRDFAGGEVIELEGAEAQLAIFDGLPETDQRDLLNAVIEESRTAGEEMGRLARSWSTGDLAGLEEVTGSGMLADEELYEALLARRNRAWAAQLENLLSAPGRPFVAVGAGHMVGEDGLPRLLEERGFTVRRIQ